MYPCKQCGDNIWNFNKVDCLIYASCKNCGNEISFEAKNANKEKMKEGSICRKCKNGKIIIKGTRAKRVYSAYYYCPNCREMYYSEDFKIKTFDRKENYKNQGSLLDHIIKENQD